MSNKVSDSLFQLIKAMSKSEKRYFKLYASRHTIGEQNNYVTLFNVIEKQEMYDEAAILKRFKKEAFINLFSITKARLYETVLASLDAFHANSSIDAQLKKELHYAEILYKKTLYQQCAKLLLSAKKTATKYEKHSTLIEIFHLEKKLYEKDYYLGSSNKDIDMLLRQDEEIADSIKTYNEFWSIKSKLFVILNKSGKARNDKELNEFKKIIDNTLINVESKTLSHETHYLYHHIYSAYYFGIGNYNKCYESLQKNIALIETNPELFKEEPNTNFAILTNIIYVASQLKKQDAVFKYLQKLRAIPETLKTNNNTDIEVKLFSSSYSIELTIYIQQGEFEKALELVPKIEEGLNLYAQKLSKVREAYFYSNIAISYFAVEKYSQALKWVNALLNDIGIAESENIHCFTQLLNLIVHIELKNDDLIPYAFKSTYRYLKTRNRVYQFEHIFLDFIGQFIKTKSREEQRKLYQKLVSELKKIAEDPFEKAAFEFFDFISWAESKVEKTSFKEIVERKNQ